ncbi:MAG: TlpA family protein disulfide reductase [Candidatus Acidiferrales bacterium]
MINLQKAGSTRELPALAAAVALALALAAPASGGGAFTNSFPAQEKSVPGKSSAVAALPVIDLSGYKKLLAKYQGKPLVVNFWATWCEPCRAEYPMLVELQHQYAPKGLAVLGVSFDQDADRNVARHFLIRYHPAFPNYREKSGDEDAFVRGVSPVWTGTIPSTIFYAPDGRISEQFIGTRPRAEFERAMNTILSTSAETSHSRSSSGRKEPHASPSGK